MTWKKGQSGNPRGRPPKNRALTAILERAGSRTITDHDGERRSGKRVLGRMLWEAATTLRVRLPPDEKGEITTVVVTLPEWIGLVQFLYKHIDGPPKAEVLVERSPAEVIIVRELVEDGEGD